MSNIKRMHNNSFRHRAQILSLLCLLGSSVMVGQSSRETKNSPESSLPNILLIVADDLGYSDLGCYGGEIKTPQLDQLAKEGIRFTRFHTAPYCAPSRAMLLTGNDHHTAGMGSQDLVTDQYGYEGHVTDRVIALPELLRTVGYQTYMTGKWHLGLRPEDNPKEKGFDHSFVNLQGVGNHLSGRGWTTENPMTRYTENGQPATWKKGVFSTDLYTDKIIQFLEENQEDTRPFFVYAAYTAPHWPLQVDEIYSKKYQGTYDKGYEILKEQRIKGLKNFGIVPPSLVPPPNHPSVRPWSALSTEEKRIEARKMELYAGMVDNLDHNIGRLFDYLKDRGKWENTLIIFLSDNGAAGEDFYMNPFDPFVREHYHNDYENMGEEDSFISYGPPWAEAGAAPYRYYKAHTTEGGMVAPMIISGKSIQRKNVINKDFISIMDLAPTIYELTGVQYPDRYLGLKRKPLKGESMAPYLSGKDQMTHDPDYVFALEHRNQAMVIKGNWKITNLISPLQIDNFSLYDLSSDPGEQHDLKQIYPEKYKELITHWYRYYEETQVQIPTPSNE